MVTVTLLGTAATMPLPERALTAALLSWGGHSLLFDCGEGTQAAAMRAGVGLSRLEAICLTHYHGDHIFGLPGLLQTIACQGRTMPLLLTGPKGLDNFWAVMRLLAGPLPYQVVPTEIGPDGLWFEGGAELHAVPTRHRVPSQGYAFTLPRAGRFDPDKARALGVPVRDWKKLQQGETVTAAGRAVRPEEVCGPARRRRAGAI